MSTHGEAAFKHTPEIETALDRGVAHHQGGRLSEAQDAYRAVLADSPNHPMALHYLGLLAHQTGHGEQALELLQKAVAVMPDYAEAQWNLATILAEFERWAEVETCCRTALKFEPDAPPLHQTLADALSATGRAEDAIAHYQNAIRHMPSPGPNFAMCHNNLGSAYYKLRRLDEARACYQRALVLDPDCLLAHQNMASVLRDQGHVQEAIDELRKVLTLAPDHVAARHNLDALEGRTTDTAPRAYVEELFDPFAENFDHHLQDKLHYQMPALMRDKLGELGLAERPYATVVDLGCGTGLTGMAFRDIATTLIGIDVSKNMIREAENKGVYDHLIVDDLAHALTHAPTHDLPPMDGAVDLFISADVFIYVGNLRETFKAASKAAAPGALFVFSTEHLTGADGFVLQDTSRYAHAKSYIDALLDEFGFEAVHFEEAPLRKEKTGWIPGALYIVKRK